MNLVVALRALLTERNVTRAGQRIGLSQPATSAALARLRRHFGDELLVRKGAGYELTALGAVLLDRSRRRLRDARAGLRQPAALRPGAAKTASSSSSPPTTPSRCSAAQLAREISAQAPAGPRSSSASSPSRSSTIPEALPVHRRRHVHAARHHHRPARRRAVPRPLAVRGVRGQPRGRRVNHAGAARRPALGRLPAGLRRPGGPPAVDCSASSRAFRSRSTASTCCRAWSRAPAASP